MSNSPLGTTAPVTQTVSKTATVTQTVNKPVRYAVVGVGSIGLTEHLPAWSAQRDVELVAVVDADETKARDAAQRFGAPWWGTDYRELLAGEPRLDVVDICTPPVTHRQMAVEFLEAGIHVLLEKPFVLTLEDAMAVREAQAGSSAVLLVAENWPYSSTVARVQQAVADGLVGTPYMLRGHHETNLWSTEPELLPPSKSLALAGGGVTISAGIHALNLARLLLGDLTEIVAYSLPRPPGPQPWLDRDVVLAARCGEHGLVSMNFTGRANLTQPRRLSFTLLGSAGVVEFEMVSGQVTVVHAGTATTYVEAAPSMGYVEEIAHFLDCVRTGRSVRTSVVDQTATLATVLAVYESMHTGRVAIPAQLTAAPSTR